MTVSFASSEAEWRARWNAMFRAFIAGYVDAFSLLKVKIFTSFMSGNTTSTGMKAGEGRFGEAAHDFLPIPCFVLGTLLGTLLQRERTPGSNFRASLAVVVLLLLSAGASALPAPEPVVVSFLAVAMGLLNTTVGKVAGQSVNPGFVTGDLKNFGVHLANAMQRKPVEGRLGAWDTHLSRAGTLGGVWIIFLAGGVIGAVAGLHFTALALIAPAVVLLVVTSLEAYTGRSEAVASATPHTV